MKQGKRRITGGQKCKNRTSGESLDKKGKLSFNKRVRFNVNASIFSFEEFYESVKKEKVPCVGGSFDGNRDFFRLRQKEGDSG
jgi:hypothetical protein